MLPVLFKNNKRMLRSQAKLWWIFGICPSTACWRNSTCSMTQVVTITQEGGCLEGRILRENKFTQGSDCNSTTSASWGALNFSFFWFRDYALWGRRSPALGTGSKERSQTGSSLELMIYPSSYLLGHWWEQYLQEVTLNGTLSTNLHPGNLFDGHDKQKTVNTGKR